MIVYVWHFSVRKETEKITRAERVVFYANTVLLYTKSDELSAGTFPIDAGPLHLLPGRDTAGRCLHRNATAPIGEGKPPAGSAALDFFPPSW
jgi:hypothetical protein